MKNISLFVLFLSLVGMAGCALPVYTLNPPEQPQPRRPLDMQNIFFSERVVGISRQYSGNKVLFIADISTSPRGQQYEAFMADKDGKNLMRLSFDGAKQVGWLFDDTKIFVRTFSSVVILDPATIKEIHKIQDVVQSCISPDKKQMAFIGKIENLTGYSKGSPYYAIYLMDESLISKKIADLPYQIRAYGYYDGSQQLFDWDSNSFFYHDPNEKVMKWMPDGLYFATQEKGTGWADFYVERKYRVNLDGSSLTVIDEQKQGF